MASSKVLNYQKHYFLDILGLNKQPGQICVKRALHLSAVYKNV